jgi:release factor glutamine methyltransferase
LDETVAQALQRAERDFAAAAIDAPRVQALALLAHVLGVATAGVLARLNEPLHGDALIDFNALTARRLAHEPLQYLLGRAHFLDFSVRVGPGVFIPRPETEQLVETALRRWAPEAPWAVDVCCGSGAIGIALARARGTARVLAIDLAAAPRQTSRQNAHDLGVAQRLTVCGGDLLTGVRQAIHTAADIGIVVCNPPYVPSGEVTQPEVRDHEPALAWEAGPSGLEVYARVVPQAAAVLRRGRYLLFELGYGQADDVRTLLLEDNRWDDIRIDDDFQGIPRVLAARRR